MALITRFRFEHHEKCEECQKPILNFKFFCFHEMIEYLFEKLKENPEYTGNTEGFLNYVKNNNPQRP